MFATPLLALSLACNIPAGDTYELTGTVIEVRGNAVVVDHEEIPGFMGPMTMAFSAEPTLTRKLTAGDRIDARLLVGDRGSRIIGIEVTGHTELPDPSEQPVAVIELGQTLPTHTLQGTAGPLTIGAGQDQVTVLSFLFTSCPVPEYCPLLASQLAALQPEIRGQARIVAVTLDPDRDSLDVLRAYGAERGADPTVWQFGRLDGAALDELLLQVGVNRVGSGEEILHSLKLLVLDTDGVVRFRADDNRWKVDEVKHAVQTAVAQRRAEPSTQD